MIIYAAIARASDAAVLADCCDHSLKGNAPTVVSLLFCHLKDNPELLLESEFQTLVHRNEEEKDFFTNFVDAMGACTIPDLTMADDAVDENYFHLYYLDHLIYCAIGDDSDLRDQKVAFAFLERIQKEFVGMYSPKKIQVAHAFGMEKSFKPNLRSAMHHFNVNHDQICQEEKVTKLRTQVQDLKNVMGQNINLLLKRGEKMEDLAHTADELENDAQVFYKRSKQVKQKQKTRYYKRLMVQAIIVGAALAGIIGFLTVTFCGWDLSRCKRDSSGGGGGNDKGGHD